MDVLLSKLLAPDDGHNRAGDRMGQAVAASEDYLVVGAPSFGETNQETGAVSIYRRDDRGTTDPGDDRWDLQQRLLGNDTTMGDRFGISVAISGTTIAVGASGQDQGASNAGAVYVFTLQGGAWVQQQKIVPGDPAADAGFGSQVSLSGDRLAVAPTGKPAYLPFQQGGAFYVFNRTGATWMQEYRLGASSHYFANHIALSGDTLLVAIGGTPWAVGSKSGVIPGTTRIYTRSTPGGTPTWSNNQDLIGTPNLTTWPVAIEGNLAVVSTGKSAVIYRRSGAVWQLEQTLVQPDTSSSNEVFGTAVDVEGGTVVVSATPTNAVYVHRQVGTTWAVHQTLRGNDVPYVNQFGGAVALGGSNLLVGAYDDATLGNQAGAAYAYRRDDGRIGLWFADTNGNDRYDDSFRFGGDASDPAVSDYPIVGDWNGDGKDDVGSVRAIYSAGTHYLYWRLDRNGNGVWESSDGMIAFGEAGSFPVVGDWNGDGKDDVGVFRQRPGSLSPTFFAEFLLDSNGSGGWDASDAAVLFGSAIQSPVIGDWNGDGRDDVGTYSVGAWVLDSNGNGRHDPNDRGYFYGGYPFGGSADDVPVVGDWDGNGTDEIGVRRGRMWILDSNGSGGYSAADASFHYESNRGMPVVGDWDGDSKDDPGICEGTNVAWRLPGRNLTWRLATTSLHDHVWAIGGQSPQIPVAGDLDGDGRDEIGLFANGAWSLDANHNGQFDAGDVYWVFGQRGDVPFLMDFDGDGRDQVAVWRSGLFLVDTNRDGRWGPVDWFGFYGRVPDIPVVGDWNGDRKDDLGVFRDGLWILDTNGNHDYDYAVDGTAVFGMAGDRPLAGDWNGDGRDDIGIWRGGLWALDANHSGVWGPADLAWSFGGLADDVPIVGDWSGNGRSKAAIVR